jgi:acyl-CoA hydrolase
MSADDLILAQAMLPADANAHGNVHGGTLMKLADSAGGTCAMRHTRRPVVTVVIDSMSFEQPVYVGNLVLVRARVTWTGHTSLETEVTIEAEDLLTGAVRHISRSYFVYVPIDDGGRPTPVRPLTATSAEARQRWDEAEQRRAVRLARRERARVPR